MHASSFQIGAARAAIRVKVVCSVADMNREFDVDKCGERGTHHETHICPILFGTSACQYSNSSCNLTEAQAILAMQPINAMIKRPSVGKDFIVLLPALK
jgi:hypothetical protein